MNQKMEELLQVMVGKHLAEEVAAAFCAAYKEEHLTWGEWEFLRFALRVELPQEVRRIVFDTIGEDNGCGRSVYFPIARVADWDRNELYVENIYDDGRSDDYHYGLRNKELVDDLRNRLTRNEKGTSAALDKVERKKGAGADGKDD